MLSSATRIGPYEILALLGQGGMGEVYRARDTVLSREVAVKALPAAFTADPDRVARFQREAQALAALSHPNIAAIYGFEQSAGVRALVMELVEGPTLADCIAKGRLPVEEALTIARQIAEALEAAHEKGIVHRDLKPANVKIRPDGQVKVLDFGLAKALDREGPPQADPAGVPKELFETRMSKRFYWTSYAPSADGRRFLIAQPVEQETALPMTVVMNWMAGLKK